MHGTGTETDPYIVDNWEDFVAAVGESGAYVNCPENAVWNMNEILPEGLSEQIYIRCTRIDGNGLTIRNLYSYAPRFFQFAVSPEINSLKLLNFDIRDGEIVYHGSYSPIFNSCSFSGVLSGTSFMSGGGRPIFNSCSFNLSLENANFNIRAQNHFMRNCHLKFEGSGTSTQNYIYFYNCLFEGTMPFPVMSGYSGVTSVSYTEYSVIDMNITQAIKDSGSGSSRLATVLINSDKVAEGVTISPYYTMVTTERLKDAEYLASTGFPVGVD